MSQQLQPTIKVAIIGTGGIAGAHVQGILAHADKVECVALCDLSDANLALRAGQLGNHPALYRDWNMLLSEQGDLDAVIIALPHQLHAPAILAGRKALPIGTHGELEAATLAEGSRCPR